MYANRMSVTEASLLIGRAVYVSVGTVASNFADKILRRQLHRLSFKGLSKFVMRVSNETPISQCPSRAVMDKGG